MQGVLLDTNVLSELMRPQPSLIVLGWFSQQKDTKFYTSAILTDWQKAGLKVACRLRLKLFTLDQNLALKTIGHLSSIDVKSVQTALTEFIDVGINQVPK